MRGRTSQAMSDSTQNAPQHAEMAEKMPEMVACVHIAARSEQTPFKMLLSMSSLLSKKIFFGSMLAHANTNIKTMQP